VITLINQVQVRRIFQLIYVSGLLLLPAVLIILPADFFDKGKSICLSVLLFDTACYGCGMTRAIQHIIHFDFHTAYSLNKISFIVFPILTGLWIGEIRQKLRRRKNGT
jgi:hypothetical protein